VNKPQIPAVISTSWLHDHLFDPGIRIIDASWSLPITKRDNKGDFLKAHIPTAQYLDIDDISDHEVSLPHMLPNKQHFERCVGALGVSNSDHIISYDNTGLYSAARVWWMFRIFAHTKVSVLDGGFPKWQREKRPVESGFRSPATQDYQAGNQNTRMVRTIEEVRAAIEDNSEHIVDARSKGRFEGTEPEVRPGVRSGHIPNSINLPHERLLARDGTLLPVEKIRSIFLAAGVDLNKPVVTSCGSGITAAVLTLGLYSLGIDNTSLYDGSWSEWGSLPDKNLER